MNNQPNVNIDPTA